MTITLTAYAKRRGVSTAAVSKAISAGRLKESIVQVDGVPQVADAEMADREWDANTRARSLLDIARDELAKDGVVTQPLRRWPSNEPASIATSISAASQASLSPDFNQSRALKEAATARRESAMADLAEIEVAEKRGELVPVEEAEAHWAGVVTIIKTRILGVPSRVAQRLPKLAAEIVPVLDALLREALEEIATIDGDAMDE